MNAQCDIWKSIMIYIDIKPKLALLSNLKCVTRIRQSIYKPLSLILHPFHDIVQLRRLSITNY